MQWSFDAREVSMAALRREIMRELYANGAKDGDYSAAELICGELVANAVRHAPGRITVHLDWRDPFPILSVHDNGKPFARKIGLPSDPLKESGRGLYIVKMLAKSFSIEDVADDGITVTAVLPVERRPRHEQCACRS